MSRSHAALLAAAATLLALAVAARAQGRSGELRGPAPLTEDAGPIEQRAPSGAFVVSDAGALAAALADPLAPVAILASARHLPRRLRRGAKGGAARRAWCRAGGDGTGTVVTVTADDTWIDNVAVRHSGRRHTVEDAGIKAKAARVRVTNVAVDDALFGVTFEPCPGCLLEHSRIRGLADEPELRGDGVKLWEASDSIVRRCVIEDARDLVVWYSRRVVLERNTVRRGRYGTHFMYAHDSVVRDSRLESNVVGIFVMYSNRLHVEGNVLAGARGPAGVGVGFKESDGVDVRDNWIVANTSGTYIDCSPRSAATPVVYERNVFALNEVALRLHSSEEGLSFLSNDFQENVTVAEVEGGGDALAVRFDGNHWTEYEGYDLDHDGRGDVPFEVKQLSGELTDAHPVLQFFEGTGAMNVIDAIAHAVPVLAAHRVLVDLHPAMTAPRPGGRCRVIDDLPRIQVLRRRAGARRRVPADRAGAARRVRRRERLGQDDLDARDARAGARRGAREPRRHRRRATTGARIARRGLHPAGRAPNRGPRAGGRARDRGAPWNRPLGRLRAGASAGTGAR